MKWIHNICCLRLIYCVIYIIYISFCFITFFHLSRSLIIPFFQNCWDLFVKYFSRCIFFHLQFGAIYHKKIFLITGTNNNQIKQDLGSTEDTIEYFNQTITIFFLHSIGGFALSWSRRFANSGHFSTMAVFNLSSWLQYFLKLMVLSREKSS